jgi:hypothetical protein
MGLRRSCQIRFGVSVTKNMSQLALLACAEFTLLNARLGYPPGSEFSELERIYGEIDG